MAYTTSVMPFFPSYYIISISDPCVKEKFIPCSTWIFNKWSCENWIWETSRLCQKINGPERVPTQGKAEVLHYTLYTMFYAVYLL